MATKVERPLEWMKFDPVKFALLADGATLEEEGALIRLLRHLWITGPLPESAIKRITRAAFEFIHPLLVEDGDLLTLEVVEEARSYGIRRVNQRVEAGIKSAEKRRERSTTVEREPTTVGTDVLSMSLSKSTSKSNSEKKERASESSQLTWPAFAGPKCRAKWAEFVAYRVSEKKLRYKTVATEQRALDLAARYFPSGPDFVSALDHTMARTWAFPVDPSEHKYPDMAKADGKPSTIKPWLQ